MLPLANGLFYTVSNITSYGQTQNFYWILQCGKLQWFPT